MFATARKLILIDALRFRVESFGKWHPRLTAYALLGALMLLSVLTGCATNTSAKQSTLNIYAPDVLRVKQGEKVQTVDGIHTAQTDEVWHSDRRFRRLETQLLQLSAQ